MTGRRNTALKQRIVMKRSENSDIFACISQVQATRPQASRDDLSTDPNQIAKLKNYRTNRPEYNHIPVADKEFADQIAWFP